jgi:hypothetical protein
MIDSVTIESQVPGTKKNYLACADENFMSTVNASHEAHFGTVYIPYSSVALGDMQNPYECFVACQNHSECFVRSIVPINTPSECYNFVPTDSEKVCPNGQMH